MPFQTCTTIRPRLFDVAHITTDNITDVHATMSAQGKIAYLNPDKTITFKSSSRRLERLRPGDILVGGYEGAIYWYSRYTPAEYAEVFRDLTSNEKCLIS